MYYPQRQVILLLLCGALIVIIAIAAVMMTFHGDSMSLQRMASLVNDTQTRWLYRRPQNVQDTSQADTTIQLLQKQRDELSVSMKQLSMEYHQYQCAVGVTKDITSHGGWCVNASTHYTDTNLASALVELFEGQTVASFGDGYGGYKTLIDRSGRVQQYDSYDGAPFCENQTNGKVKFLDLSIPVFGLRLYDWVISLEVGEHIPKKYEQTFLDNIARHAKNGVVLSWAVPNQGGHGHINCQTLEYIEQQLDNRGFFRDHDCSVRLQNASHIRWLKQNTNVYKRKAGHVVNILMV